MDNSDSHKGRTSAAELPSYQVAVTSENIKGDKEHHWTTIYFEMKVMEIDKWKYLSRHNLSCAPEWNSMGIWLLLALLIHSFNKYSHSAKCLMGNILNAGSSDLVGAPNTIWFYTHCIKTLQFFSIITLTLTISGEKMKENSFNTLLKLHVLSLRIFSNNEHTCSILNKLARIYFVRIKPSAIKSLHKVFPIFNFGRQIFKKSVW